MQRLPAFFLPLALLAFALLSGPAGASPSEAGFAAYAREYQQPQYYLENDNAFSARLKLLDMAPKGAQARIATFTFDNGKVVLRLARHVCLAARRGVQVQLLVDSKSGEQPGVPNVYNRSEDAQIVEELYQYMANCGASVYIHNGIRNYIEVFGHRIPNIFLDHAKDGMSFGLTEVLWIKSRVDYLIGKLSAIIQAELWTAGVRADSGPLLANFKTFVMDAFAFLGTGGGPSLFQPSVGEMAGLYLQMLRDPFWDSITPAQMRRAISRIENRVLADPELAILRRELRRFNRLNHRKLFLVQNKAGGEGCMLLGGRNLGDHYLASEADSYLDGDVLLCRHHSPEASRAIADAIGSFESLKTDLADPVLGRPRDNFVYLLPKNPAYVYQRLRFPPELAPAGARMVSGSSSRPNDTLLPERRWKDTHALPGELLLENTRNWKLLKATWDPKADEVRAALLESIHKETKELSIETAYAEFDAPLRGALHDALERGVKVRLITNSFFITDGLSKLIRILMSNWIEKTKAAYPKNFQVLYATFQAGHMTHFKAAAFACQKSGAGMSRVYFVGSHNFHPRSGWDDKEHALRWEEPSDCAGLAHSVPVATREQWYKSLAKKLGTPVLKEYPDFYSELAEVGSSYSGNGHSLLSAEMARSLVQVFYNSEAVKEEKRVRKILNLMDQGGLHDMLGKVM